jgi:DNA modification methylase
VDVRAVIDLTVLESDPLLLIHGDCIATMASMPAASVDAIVTDPPYGIGFMGREWDSFAPSEVRARLERDRRKTTDEPPDYKGNVSGSLSSPAKIRYDYAPRAMLAYQAWCAEWGAAAWRVLRPGGFLLCSGSTRTYHRMASGLEDAGFVVRDCLVWMYASGFPKSLNIRKAFEAQGAPEFAAEWDGWGTALKPAHEPVVIAQKPLAADTYTANIREHGVGALNIDGSRVGVDLRLVPPRGGGEGPTNAMGAFQHNSVAHVVAGRWPANVVLSHTEACAERGTTRVPSVGQFPSARGGSRNAFSFGGEITEGGARPSGDVDGMETVEVWDCVPECAVRLLDEQSGPVGDNGGGPYTQPPTEIGSDEYVAGRTVSGGRKAGDSPFHYGDAGGASRFFYVAKADDADRNPTLSAAERSRIRELRRAGAPLPDDLAAKVNNHPTVKPVELMRHLVRLVTPRGGIVLDPFAGSGSTGQAALEEGVRCVLIERELEYVDGIRAWRSSTQLGLGLR